MSCLTALSLACLFQPDQLYVTGSVLKPVTEGRVDSAVCNSHGARHWCRGVMGELKIGMRIELTPRFDLDYGVRHSSFLTENDRGDESAFLSVSWRPLR